MQNSDLRSLVDKFVQDLTAAINSSVHEALGQALGEGSVARGRGGRRPGRGVGKVARGAAPAARARGQKRTPEELEKLTADLRAYIVKNPGQRIEQIGQGMGVPTKELALPAKKLIGDKKLSTKGAKRATTYFAKGG